MACHVTRPARYQGGVSFNVFSAQGSNPTGDCKVCGKGVQKLYDKSVKTYVYSLCGGPASKIQLPKDENKTGLQLLQPFLVFQIFVPNSQPLALELRVTDTTNTRRKMYFSTSFSDIKSTPLHCQIPLAMVNRSVWLSLSIHVADLFAHCFKGMIFKSIDTIVLGPVCKLRKIFTMRNQLLNIGSMCNSFDVSGENYLPQEHVFAPGVDNAFQVLDMMAIQKTINDAFGPSNEEDILKLQKVKLNKSESRQVHVAFGSRMPLPLSTVQINANLPNDNKLHPNKAFRKEREQLNRASRNTHPQSETPLCAFEQNRVENRVENKSETLQNLLKHANNFNKNHTMLKLRKDHILLDQDKLPLETPNEPLERSLDGHFSTQELKLPSNLTTMDAIKRMQMPTNAGIEGVTALWSLTRDNMMNMPSKDDPHLQWSNDEVHSKSGPESMSLDNEASKDEAFEENTNKAVTEGSQTFVKKKIEEHKSPDLKVGLGKYIRRKEYKQSRYIDSPPESPPCGWTSCTEDDNEEKPLRLPSFFNKLCDNMGDLEKSKDGFDIGSAINGTSHSMDSLDLEDEGEQHVEETIQNFLNDEHEKYDHSSKKLYIEQPTRDMVRPTSESVDNFMEDRARPTGVTHEKFDLENGDNFMFHDSKLVRAMSDEDYNFGRHCWSSNDQSQQEQGHTLNPFSEFSYHYNFYNDKVMCDKENLKNAFIQSDLEGGEQFLVTSPRTSKNSQRSSQELNTFQNENETSNNSSFDHPLRFLNKYIDDHEFNGTTSITDIERLRSSPIRTQLQSRTSNGDTRISICNDNGPYEACASLSNESMESISKHSISSFTLKNEQENVKEVEVYQEHEDASITINNGRLDEDLDLLYDPTLDCYYDPKTNRYYELK